MPNEMSEPRLARRVEYDAKGGVSVTCSGVGRRQVAPNNGLQATALPLRSATRLNPTVMQRIMPILALVPHLVKTKGKIAWQMMIATMSRSHSPVKNVTT